MKNAHMQTFDWVLTQAIRRLVLLCAVLTLACSVCAVGAWMVVQ